MSVQIFRKINAPISLNMRGQNHVIRPSNLKIPDFRMQTLHSDTLQCYQFWDLVNIYTIHLKTKEDINNLRYSLVDTHVRRNQGFG